MPKAFYLLLRHVPTVDDSEGRLTAPRAHTELHPVDTTALGLAATVVDHVAASLQRSVTMWISPTDRAERTAEELTKLLKTTARVVATADLLNIDQGKVGGMTQLEFS